MLRYTCATPTFAYILTLVEPCSQTISTTINKIKRFDQSHITPLVIYCLGSGDHKHSNNTYKNFLEKKPVMLAFNLV